MTKVRLFIDVPLLEQGAVVELDKNNHTISPMLCALGLSSPFFFLMAVMGCGARAFKEELKNLVSLR